MAKKSLLKPVIISLLIISLLVFASQRGWIGGLKNYFFKFIEPVQSGLYRASAGVHKYIGFLASPEKIIEENVELSRENQRLLGELAQYNGIIQENRALREQLNLSAGGEKQLILANVIGQVLSGSSRHILIDKGSKDGVENRVGVIAPGNILIGKVVEVMDSFSKIQLITDESIRVNAVIQGSEVICLAHGESDNLIIDSISQGRDIEDNGLVVTSGLAGIFPAGLLIGRIEKIISTDVQVFQKAKIDPIVNFKALGKVFVIKD